MRYAAWGRQAPIAGIMIGLMLLTGRIGATSDEIGNVDGGSQVIAF